MRKHRVLLIFLSIFIFTLIIQGIIPIFPNKHPKTLQNSPNSPIGVFQHDSLTGIGYGLNYTEYANRTDMSSLSLNYNTITFESGSGTTTLAANWEGYMMDVQVYDLTQNRTYLENYDFYDGETNWTQHLIDSGSWTNNPQAYIATDGGPGGAGDDCAHVELRGDHQKVQGRFLYNFDAGDLAAYNQTITIQGSTVVWAGIEFDWRAKLEKQDAAMFRGYVSVNSTEVWTHSYNDLGGINGVWQHQNMTAIDHTPFGSTVTIEIGLYCDASIGYVDFPRPDFEFDNVKIYIISQVLPSTVNLEMNGLTVNDNGFGNGYVTQIPGTRWQTSPLATFTWTTTPNPPIPDLPVTLDFGADVNLFALKESNLLYDLTPSALGTKYTIQDGLNTSWEMYSLISTPNGYWNHYLNFSIPSDWNFTGLYEPQNPTVNIIDMAIGGNYGDGYVQINLTDITNSPNGYWRLTSASPNYVTNVTPTDTINPKTNYRIGDVLRINSTIINAPAGYANLSIYDPVGALWSSEVMQPSTNQFYFSNISLVGSNASAGEYEAVVWWNNRSVADASDSDEAGLKRALFSVTHSTELESYDIATIQTDEFYNILPTETFVLKAKYTDTDNGLGIDDATVQIEWIDSNNYTMVGLGGGFYQIDSLNTSQPIGIYNLTMYAEKSYFDVATKQILVEIIHHASLTPNVTSITVDWGENVTIQVYYNDTDSNLGIVGADVQVSSGWQSGSWFNGSLGSGYYYLTFATTWATPDTLYEVDITANQGGYQTKTRQISIFVRARISELSYVPPDSPPIKDSINITINFLDGVNGTGISNSTSQLYFSVNSSLSGYYSIYEITAGVFYLEVNTSAPAFTQTGTYVINLDASWTGIPYYANKSIAIKLTVRQIITSLTYDPPSDIPYGNNVNITVHYRVTDTDSKFNGLGIVGAQINITTVGYSYGTNYTVNPHATITGDYIITIYNNTLNSINTFSITIEASGLTNYETAQRFLDINVRKLYSLLLINPVGAVPYGNNVTISFQVLYSDPVSQWYDDAPITGLSLLNFNMTGNHSFNINEIGNGNYIAEVLNGTVLTLGTYQEYIALLEGGLFLSDNRSVSWTIRKLISSITINPIVDIPYGNDLTARIHVTYDDSASQLYDGDGIAGLNTSHFNVTGGHSFSITEIGNGDYDLIIDNGTITNIQAYSETLTLYENGLFQSATTPLSFSVRNLYTELVADLVPAQPLGENVTVTVHYQVKDTLSSYYNGQGITGAQINITTAGYTFGTDYTVTEIGNGEYQVIINNSKLSVIQTYLIDLKASGVANYDNASTSSTFSIRAIATSFVYIAPSPAAWGTNVTIDLTFSVEDSLSNQNGNPLPGANSITVNESNPSFVGDWTDLGSGNYQVELNTTGFSMGTYYANISIYMNGYINRSLIVRFDMRAHFTQVTYDIPDPTPWGKNTSLTVYFEDIDLNYNKVYPVFNITVNETQNFSYNWVDNGDGSFSIELDTTDPAAWPVGTQKVQVNIYKYAYQNSTTTITITIKTRDTDLIYQTPDITPFLQNATIKIQYRDLKNSTSPVGINNNTNPQIPGLQNSAGNVSISVIILDSNLSQVGGANYWIYTMEGVPGYGDGWYNITVDTNSLGLTGTYYADIDITWFSLSYYNNQSIRIPFNVRNITALLEYQPPGSTPYAEGGYISIWLKYTDVDNSLPIDVASVNIYNITDPNDLPLSPFTEALGNYTVEGTGVGDNDRGSGWYLVKIFMGTDKLNDFGSYDISIRFNKTNYDTREIANITFAIRQGYSQFTSPYAPLAYVINGIVNISINYIDSESGIGIVNTTSGDPVLLNWTWPFNATLFPDVMAVYGWSNGLNRWVESGDNGSYPMGEDGRYLLQINFTSIPAGNRSILSMNISAGQYIQSQILNITFIIEAQTSVMGVTFPQPVVWGENSVFNVTYQKIDGSGIPGTGLNLWDLDRLEYWNSSYWNYTTVDAGTGLYGITINTTLHPPPSSGFHRIRVDASGGSYTPRSLNVFVNVRSIDSQVTITPPAATGWNTLANITIQYYDTFNSVPINDSDITDLTDVILNVTNIPNTYWTLYNGPANGYYIIEINTSYWTTLNEVGHSVYIDISWEGAPYYKNWTGLLASIPVRSRNTDLSYVPPIQIPFGENASVTFEWRDLEITGGQGIENISGNVIFELRDWLNQAWNSSGYAWISELGNGQYEVEINSSKLPTTGTYTFTAYFSWPGQPFYTNRSISFSINVRQVNTILIYGIPAPIPYGNPFQLNVQFNVSDSSSSWDGSFIAGALLNITSISNSGGPLSPFSYGNNYSVTDNGFGSYTITIFNTTLDVDSYSISIQASYYNINKIYKNATTSLSFTVRALTTTLTYISPLPVPWGNNVNINISYSVNDPTSLYWNGVEIDIATWTLSNGTVWIQGVEYNISGIAGSYTITIDNETVYGANIGTFVFDITVNSSNNRFQPASFTNIPFTVRRLTTTITYIPTTPEPFGNNVTLSIYYNISDPESLYYNNRGLDVSAWTLSNSSGSWTSGVEFNIIGSNGAYILTIINNVYSTTGTYTFDIQANAIDNRYTNVSLDDLSFTIRALTTTLTYIPATPQPFGNNITIQVFYNVSDPESLIYNGAGLNVTTWSLTNASGSWNVGTEYQIIGANGTFTFIIFNNVYSTIGTQTFDIQADEGSGLYKIATFDNVPFTIRALTTAITYIPAVPTPFGNNVSIQILFNISDPASVLYDGMGVNVTIWSLTNISGPWSVGIEYLISGSDGVFDLTILSNVYDAVGNFYFNIQATPSSSIHSSAITNNIIFNIRALTTVLSIIPVSPVPIGNNVTNLRVFYNVSDPDSAYNGLGLDATFELSNASGSWTASVQYLVTGGSGVFDFTILNNVYATIGAYSFDIQANPIASLYSSATFSNVPFTIRALTTAISYVPTLPTPFGNNITINIFMNVSDSASVLYDGMGLTVTNWTLSNISGQWTEGVEYDVSGTGGAYTFTIIKDVYSTIGSYSFDMTAEMGNPIYEPASLINIPFSIRALITAITYNPTITQPYGNNVSIEVFFNVSDPASSIDGLGLNVTWDLSNSSGQWSEGNEYLMSGSNGFYLLTIKNSIYNSTGSFYFDILGDPINPEYSNASFAGLPFKIRALITSISWTPAETQPWGNPVNVTVFYNVSDPGSVLFDGLGLNVTTWTLSNSSNTWTLGVEYTVTGENGVFQFILDNGTVTVDVGTYIFNIFADSGNVIYQTSTVSGIPFTIRPLITRLTYTPIPNVPWGNNVTISFLFNVSDPESLWYHNQGISSGSLTVTRPSGWNFGADYTSSGNNGVYTLDITNTTVNVVQNYRIDVQAATLNPKYEPASVLGLPFTIRELATVLTYDPVAPVPYGNPVNITVHYIVSDPESDWYDGQAVAANTFNITSPAGWVLDDNWTYWDESPDYIITIFNSTANVTGSYSIDLEVLPVSAYFSPASFSNIPFSVRALNTFLIYPTTVSQPWGDNATINLVWQVIDSESIYYDGELIPGGQLEITSPSNWTYWQDYVSQDQGNGSYILNINKDTVNQVKTYIIDVKAYALNVDYYTNITYKGLPFSIQQVVTSHTTIINSTYYLDAIGGWPWGDIVNVTVLYNDTDRGTLVPNSNISVQGDTGSPYESGNFTINGIETTIAGSPVGIFVILINGTVAENAIGYNFYITLFHPTGNYLNHTFLVTISFRKSVSQIILKNPPVFVPWGDNISITFTYNNSEAVGFPGIPGANVNVTVDNPNASGYFTYYEWAPASWIILMNTTWANITWNSQIEITFTISAVAPETLVAFSFHTVFITPLDSDLKTIQWDSSVYLEQANSFNVTVELRDRSHFNSTDGDFNLIANNSYWSPTGSVGQYDNVQFIISTREGQFTNYTWYWGDVNITTVGIGLYKLTFFFNQTPTYPVIQELIDYLLIIEVRGDRLDSGQTQVTVDLQLQTHETAMTFNWTYANTTITPNFNLTQFTTFNQSSSYFYGEIIDIYLYWWDLDSGDQNPGISAAFITTEWDPLYYQVFNLYELNSQNESYRGIFWIQINTGLFDDVVGNYSIKVNATLETYQRIYLLTQGTLNFTVLPVPINVTLVEPLLSCPITAYVRLLLNFTNSYSGEPVIVRIQELNITNVPGPMGANKWAVSTGVPGEINLFVDSNVLGLGFHVLTIELNKTNHELTYINYTVEVRLINTTIVMENPLDENLGDSNLNAMFRENYSLKFYYKDDTETYLEGYTKIGYIPLASFNISGWRSIGGRATLDTTQVPSGIYKIDIQTTANVNTYLINITANRTNFAMASYIMNFTVIQAESIIDPVDPESISFQIWKFGSQKIEVHLLWRSKAPYYYNESIEGTITFTIKNDAGFTVASGTFSPTGVPGHYTANIDTGSLNMQESYDIILNATPIDPNYRTSNITLIAFIKPIWEHPIFIIVMIGLAAVAGAYAYRKAKWMLLPREIKAIEIAKKRIKKGREVELPFRDIIDRESMFSKLFADNWHIIGIKPPKLVRPEVVLFASEMTAILRTRMTTSEAETIINTLRTMSAEDAERYLGEMKVPPEATRRLLIIAGLIEKERLEVINFAQVLGDMKGMEISYSQAEEIMNTLQSMTPFDADKYLEAMVIPAEERQRLLDMIGVKPFAAPKKVKEPKKEKIKEKEKEKEVKEKPMDIEEIRKALNKIEGLSAEEKESLIKDMQKLTLKEQKEILKNLGG